MMALRATEGAVFGLVLAAFICLVLYFSLKTPDPDDE